MDCRPIALLEVLIAFTLVVLCALPLIYPHVAIFKAEKAFVATVNLDHAIKLLYANRLEKLYLQEISWEEIQSHREFPIEVEMLQESGIKQPFPFQGTYRFDEGEYKPKDRVEDSVHLMKLVFKFTPTDKKKEALEYTYPVVIEYKPK